MKTLKAIVMVAALALAFAGLAFAQTTGGTTVGVGDLQLVSMVQSIAANIRDTFTTTGPSLYGLLGIVGAFFFVWGRVRSLW